MAKKVMKKLKEEVGEKGPKLSVTENDKEGKSKMIASCGFLENELSQFSKEGVTLADSVETLGVDLRTRVKKLGAKDKARKRKCKVRFSIIKKNKAVQKNYMKEGVKKLLRTGMMPARTCGAHAVGMSPTEMLGLWGQMAAAAGKRRAQPRCPNPWRHMAWNGHSVLDGRSTDRKMEPRAEGSLNEADSRGSNVETGKRTSRSSDV